MAACKRFWSSLSIVCGVFAGGIAGAAEPPSPAPGAALSDAADGSRGWVSSAEATQDPGTSGKARAAEEFTPGFEAGLRLGVGLPVGKAGRALDGSARSVGDLAPWRVPIWIDAGYRASPSLSYGAYGQFGVGGTSDPCAGRCNWSDLRLGVQVGFQLAPNGRLSPWLGVGLGYEWLSAKTVSSFDTGDVAGVVPFSTTELLGGPELGVQAGLDFHVDDALRIGPYAAASVGDYLGDRFKCEPAGLPCPSGSSIDGSGVHAWLGVGVRASYGP